MPKVKNEYYNAFLKGDLIKIISRDEIEKVLDNISNIKTKMGYDLIPQARALTFILWATGARPCEVMDMTADDVSREGAYVKVKLKGAKGAFARVVYLPYKDCLVKEFYEYTKGLPPMMYLFWFFRSNMVRRKTKAKFATRDPQTGEKKIIEKVYEKVYPMKADKLRYYFKKWFSEIFPEGICPYYLRHNRFSSLSAEGRSLEEIRMLKGSKTYDSVVVYTHMSEDMAKKLSKDLVK